MRDKSKKVFQLFHPLTRRIPSTFFEEFIFGYPEWILFNPFIMALIQLTREFRPFYAEAFLHEEVTYFRIYQANEYRFTMGLNEKKIWESVEKADPDLVRKLGGLIEKMVTR